MITVLGEALLDLVADADGARFNAHLGGSPANVAVGLARLGVPTSLASQLADDLPGRLITDRLRRDGVALRALPARSAQTGLAFAATDERGIATYDFRLAWDITQAAELAPGCQCLHTGSLAAMLAPGADVVERQITELRRQGQILISYDPNLRPSLMGPRDAAQARVERLVGQADIVKASVDDLDWLYPGVPFQQAARRWLAGGPALIVITLGERGGYGLSHAAEVTLPTVAVAVADTIGAGDAFTAALLHWLRRADLLDRSRRDALASLGADALADAMNAANLAAAMTCERHGADPPTWSQITARPAWRRGPATGPDPPRGAE